MSKEMTPWFPGDVKPVRVGAYQTDGETGDPECFQHWDGTTWGYLAFCAEEAAPSDGFPSQRQNSKWRGLAKKP